MQSGEEDVEKANRRLSAPSERSDTITEMAKSVTDIVADLKPTKTDTTLDQRDNDGDTGIIRSKSDSGDATTSCTDCR